MSSRHLPAVPASLHLGWAQARDARRQRFQRFKADTYGGFAFFAAYPLMVMLLGTMPWPLRRAFDQGGWVGWVVMVGAAFAVAFATTLAAGAAMKASRARRWLRHQLGRFHAAFPTLSLLLGVGGGSLGLLALALECPALLAGVVVYSMQFAVVWAFAWVFAWAAATGGRKLHALCRRR